MVKNKRKVVMAMSGGIDSSVSAYLLKKQGFEVIGVYMRLKPEDDDAERFARKVTEKLKIKFYPINLMDKFKKKVIDYFLDSYKKGITPNPCVKCNQFIKFVELLRITGEMKADYLATGHYIKKLKIKKSKYVYKLLKGKDIAKDQSYFLYNLNQEQLRRVLFPLDNYTKDEIRKIAEKVKLPYLVKESQDICFLNNDHNIFLKKHLVLKAGKIKILNNNKIIGKHQGLPLYTIGQRRGVEIGGTGPYYVVECDYETNVLYVTADRDDFALYSNKLIVNNVNWISGNMPKMPLKCEAVIRYRHKSVKCEIKKKNLEYIVKFEKSQRAITKGQSVVFYNRNEILGGGIIKNLDF